MGNVFFCSGLNPVSSFIVRPFCHHRDIFSYFTWNDLEREPFGQLCSQNK